MDKAKFVELAPTYYAIAIRAYFEGRHSESVASRATLKKAYSYEDESGSPDLRTYLENDVLLDCAIRWMIDQDLLGVIEDDFGPSLYLQTDQADAAWEAIEKQQNGPYFRYHLTPHSERSLWLNLALGKINLEYSRLDLSLDDFDEEDIEWEPLPLDRADDKLLKSIEAIGETVEAVRKDNGYSATQPEEKAYILEGLSACYKKLKEAETVSVPYIKTYALEPLARLIRRFGPAAIGVSATLSKDALYSWLKAAGVKGLEYLWRAIFGN